MLTTIGAETYDLSKYDVVHVVLPVFESNDLDRIHISVCLGCGME
jgi:hypothetical protein